MAIINPRAWGASGERHVVRLSYPDRLATTEKEVEYRIEPVRFTRAVLIVALASFCSL
jgi:hypothetical protein